MILQSRLWVALHLLFLQSQVNALVTLAGWALFLVSIFAQRWPSRLSFLSKSWVVESFSGLAAVLVIASLKALFTVEVSAGLIFLFLPLELFRLNTRRSQWRFVFLLFFSLALILLEYQGFWATLGLILDLVLIFQLMIQFEGGKSQLSWAGLRSALGLVALTLPLWIFVFFFFPRFSLELWGAGPNQGEVGYSDQVQPGSIEKLVLSNELAFRVRWQSAVPSGPLHYFRGAVLERGEGLSWFMGPREASIRIRRLSGNEVQHEISSTGKAGRTLIALDSPLRIQIGEDKIAPFQRGFYRMMEDPKGPLTYRAWSISQLEPVALNEQDRNRMTSVSEEIRQGILTWWIERGSWSEFQKLSLDEKLSFLQKFYRQQNFAYSLTPPKLETGGVVEFLNKSRVGFCEHFAGLTATLMRLSGVPARVVVGFLGGRPDPFSRDWIVMNREAHAWVEVYDDRTQTWRREDPTGWVEPLRLQVGAESYWMSPEAKQQWAQTGAKLLPWWMEWRDRWGLLLDSTAGATQRWVLSYNTDWFKNLLTPWGLDEQVHTISFLFILGFLGVLSAFVPWVRFVLRPLSGWKRLWIKFGKRLRVELNGKSGEWEEWTQIREQIHPRQRQLAEHFVKAYLAKRYGSPDSQWNSKQQKELEQLIWDIPSEIPQKGMDPSDPR